MKNLIEIGSVLNKKEQKMINGGTNGYGTSSCGAITCPPCSKCRFSEDNPNYAYCEPDPTQMCFDN